MKRVLVLGICLMIAVWGIGQNLFSGIDELEEELNQLKEKEKAIQAKIEAQKLTNIQAALQQYGLPKLEVGEELINHAAMSLVYSEKHEQAKWVAHIISPDIRDGNVSRSNDFRSDPKVKTGTAIEQDYFLKYLQPDSTYEYDGFGYDRGHLAPSADFRWSELALSESYFYSNMSPQAPEFNRGKWAELEGILRGYLYQNPKSMLYVVTGPVLENDLPVIDRSVNRVSIPKQYFKVVVDLQNERAIGFLMPNQELTYPLSSFATSIDQIEEVSGLDLFPQLEDELENRLEGLTDATPFLPQGEQSDVKPIYAPSLPPKHFNTVQAKRYQNTGEEITVCGTVVSTKLSRKGNVFLNLDKKFPNQIFSVTIWKDQVVNFSYPPHEVLMGQQVCVNGIVRNFQGTPTMNVEREEQVKVYEGN